MGDLKKSIEALITIAESNFPYATKITIIVSGKNTAGVTLTASELRKMLK